MPRRESQSPPRKPKARGKKKGGGAVLASRPRLEAAIDRFLSASCAVESSQPVADALELMRASASIQEIFAIPVRRHVLTMESALLWAFFLSRAPQRAETEGDLPLGAPAFSAKVAFACIGEVFDHGVEEKVLEYFETSASEGESGDDADASDPPRLGSPPSGTKPGADASASAEPGAAAGNPQARNEA